LEQDIKILGERNWTSLAFWRVPGVVVVMVMYILFFSFSDGWQEDDF
jgi:hypothetical protein